MKSTVNRCHPSVVRLLISTLFIALPCFLSGCGSVSGTQQPASNDDPDRLPSTVIDDDGDYGEYAIVASKAEDSPNEFAFSVEAKRGVLDEWTWQWNFGGDEPPVEGTDQTHTFDEAGSYLVQVTAIDRQGNIAFVLTLELDVENTNEPPVADAGQDQTVVEGGLVFLYGGASADPDASSLTYQWAQLSGDPVMLLAANEVTASFVAPRVDADSVLEFSLTVSDGELSSQDTVTVHVSDYVEIASLGPVADAGPDVEAVAGETVALDGSASHGSGKGELSVSWTQIVGPSVDLIGASDAVAIFVAPEVLGDPVEFGFELLVTEGDLSAADEVVVIVASSVITDDDGGDPVDGTDQCPNDPAKTEPGRCGCGVPDTDSDRDGTADCVDGCPADAAKVTPGACGCGVEDVDTDSDGVADCNDNCPNDSQKIEPGLCGCGNGDTDSDSDGTPDCLDSCPGGQDTDSDGDGVLDCHDGCPNDPNKTSPGPCGCGVAEVDGDGDGTPDCNDACADDPLKTEPGECGCGVNDNDRDGDGTPDCNDNCPDDSQKTGPGLCGCGIDDDDTDVDGVPDCMDLCPGEPDLDSDNDGVLNCNDGCPNDASKTEPGVCGCGVADLDSDGDGVEDCDDECPNDPFKVDVGQCGCGVEDYDSDDDGLADCVDRCPDDPDKFVPGLCGCGVADADSDNDGTVDCYDDCPHDPGKTEPGICGCGTLDLDSDDDGVANCVDQCPGEPDVDTDNDGVLNCDDDCPLDPAKLIPGECGCSVSDVDSDNDGVPDCNDECPAGQDVDSDGDGVLDCHDGCPDDPDKIAPGVCGCEIPDNDSDGDGIPNCNDQCPGEPDVDSDGDGSLDCEDGCPQDPAKQEPGVCGCGVTDDDNDQDGVADCDDLCPADGTKTAPGVCGCGVPDDDTDLDGVADCDDLCPLDPGKDEPGVCGCGVDDLDSDDDGTPNCNDGCPIDPGKTQPGTCGCNVSDADSDNDGVPDCHDACPGEPDVDSDGDGVLNCNDECPVDPDKIVPGVCGCGVDDVDRDNDGTLDCNDECPTDPGKTQIGVCGCGAPDTDSDDDGTPDCQDSCPNDPDKTQPGTCGCGAPDTDSDDDGTPDCIDRCPGEPDVDSDGDGTLNCDDGCPSDPAKTQPGTCGCGAPDNDSDNDGTLDCNDSCPNDPSKTEPGVCGCGVSDADTDSDGTVDCQDSCPNDSAKTQPGTCGCGVSDGDSDGDGVADCDDVCAGFDDTIDTDADGTPDGCESPDGGSVTEDFEGYSVGAQPTDWMDTNADNSLAENDSLFAVFQVGGDNALGTTSTATNIHSHYVGQEATSGSSFEFTGRMRLSDTGGGVGVTFLSAYPSADAYYRLRRFSGYGGDAFQISPHGTSVTGGTANSGVEPVANTWYQFRVELEDTGSRTDIRAKVWVDGASEPGNWQIDCYDSSATRLTSGTIGVWSMASGTKHWDDLNVSTLNCDVDSDGDGVADCTDGCVNDPAKTQPGVCGCGVADTDSDGDGVANCNDQCPGAPDIDSDGDGTADCSDGCPDDPQKTAPGACGCGSPDEDSNNNGTPDCQDPPMLCVNPNSLSFGSAVTSLALEVWNCGGGSLDYTVGGDAVWLAVSPVAGNSTGERDTITASVERSDLPDDTYQAEITVSPSVGTSVAVLVTMTVGASGAPMNTASRDGGISPLAVFFDAVEKNGTTGTGVIQPPTPEGYAEYHYKWDFGDPLSGTWQYGRKNAPTLELPDGYFPSKNEAIGYVAAHVFENPGPQPVTYPVTLTVTTPEGIEYRYHQDIVVDPFPANGTTYYVSSSTGSDMNSGLSEAAPFKTWNKGVNMLFGAPAPARLLLKRGEEFTTSTGYGRNSGTGPYIMAAYGTGDTPPVIRNTGANRTLGLSPAVSGVRVVDVDFKGPYPGGTPGEAIVLGTEMLVLRCNISGHSYGAKHSGSRNDEVVFSECEFKNNSAYGFYYAYGKHVAAQGSYFDRVATEHLVRTWITHSLIQHNTFKETYKHQLKFIGFEPGKTPFDYAEYDIISDNDFDQASVVWPVVIGPENSTTDQRLRHTVVERNFFRASAHTTIALMVNNEFVTVRNNVVDGRGSSSGNFMGIQVTRRGIEPAPKGHQVYNNTFYRANCAIGLFGGASDVKAINNLLAAPGISSPILFIPGAGDNIEHHHNLLDNDPGFENPGIADFHLSDGSRAIEFGESPGAMILDFELNFRPVDGNGVGGAEIDAGAFEFLPTP